MDAFDHIIPLDLLSKTSSELLVGLKQIFQLVTERRPTKGVVHCPPILHPSDCPPISIITPTYNRKKLIDIAFHNLLATDYPADKIEWVVIEDSEQTEDFATEEIMNFQIKQPKIAVKYIPIQGRMSIGQKRNIAIEHSTHDIILFMDDDDHYPTTSFRRRVAWLLKGRKGVETTNDISVCTTIALYDLIRGVSAVNVPPWGLSLGKRISEATLTFRKSAWLERKFDDVSISEGEAWIKGRENRCIEMPPQQIIVAFSHKSNVSTRRIPSSDIKEISCFWGFPREYLIFIHELAGMDVEEEGKKKNKVK
jgi:glycosyltransferase involved in cell wall biosynthesis